MKYYNIKNTKEVVSFKEATLKSQASDGGLYFPSSIPKWEKDFLRALPTLSKSAIGFHIMKPYVGDDIPDDVLLRIIEDVLNFDFPLQPIDENSFSLELFHGPTLAFKDLGARFISRVLQYFREQDNATKKMLVLVATSGDTGGAVADAFAEIESAEVVILYPSGKVSPVQEKQLTTHGGNIHAFEILGDFDDCQRLAKKAFLDQDLQRVFQLTSSNSINISRWLPQQIYYALALAEWKADSLPVVAVPSGNFGNLCAGLLAKASGLPIDHFVAACNSNAVFCRYLESGNYIPHAAIPTISNAMDVGNPSNVVRIIELFKNDYHALKNDISGFEINDQETKNTIAVVFSQYQYTLDPHSAVAYSALKKYLRFHPSKKGIILSTAHPIKFPDTVESATGQRIIIPESLKKIMKKKKLSTLLNADYELIKEKILEICA